ncbi:GNAT family N-acetyltransferase [Phreatobacter stygius]|uniref:GNAT family N-acetyltransferase n=1 Tax=Phreatobacter stygius TaxID=1940610 RepID=A0A4D7B937_9HYPH|nr:GNAT family N-acetyltransferase [Phreatobacter stygius]QCI67000.1 GNAT family N-acetyltransferase [Phreatobacter stygius]
MATALFETPASAIDVLRLPAARITVRAIEPADAALLQGHVRGLTRASRQNRFLGGINELTAAELDRITHHGAGNIFGLFAETDVRGETLVVGEAIYAVEAATGISEFALSVADAWHGRGVGQALITSVECRAARAGSLILAGETLRSNDAMLALAAKSGFVTRRHPDEARLWRLEKVIGAFQGMTPCSRLDSMRWSMAA